MTCGFPASTEAPPEWRPEVEILKAAEEDGRGEVGQLWSIRKIDWD